MAVLLSGTTIGGHVAVHANNISTYALTSVPSTISPTNIYVGNAIYFGGGNNYFNWDGARINSNVGIQSASDMRSPIFYDSADTNYYLDPNSTSVLNRVYTTGRLEVTYNADRYQMNFLRGSGSNWWVTNDSDKLGLHLNNVGDRIYFATDGNIWSSYYNDWLSNIFNSKQNAYTAITTSNIGSQSVASASQVSGVSVSAAQAQALKNTLDSPTLPYKCDIYVEGDPNTYYPVHFIWGDQDIWRRIIIRRGYSEEAPWDPIGTGVHHGGLLLDWEGNFGGWGGAEYSDRLRVFNESYTNVCADMYIYTHAMGYVFMLRGGHALYHIFSDQEIRGYHQVGTPDIAYSTSTLFYDHSIEAYKVYAPAPVTTINSSRIDGLRTKKQSLFDNRYQQISTAINTGNIGSQSVNYASSAGNADTLDSLDSSEFARGRASYQVLNLDTIKQPGLYQYDGGIGGTQPEGADQANLRTIEIGSGGRYSQMAFDWASEQAWFRRQTGDTWSTWREFIHSGNIGSQSVSYATTAGSASTVTGSSTINGYLTLNTDWGVSPYTSAFNIIGTHPSMTFRGSNGDTHYLIHMDSAGDIQYYFGPGYLTNNWTRRYEFTKGGNFSVLTGNISASGTVTGSNLSGTNTGDQTNISGNAATATYATTAGSLTSMNISQFTNNSGYITSVPNLQYGGGDSLTGAGTATTWDPRPGPVYDRYVIGNHTGISLHGYPGYGGVRLYSAGYPTLTTSVLRLEASDAVYTFGGLYSDGRAVIHTGNIASQSVASAGNATTANGANGNFYIDDNYGNTVVGLYDSTRYQGVFAMGDAYKLPANGTTTGNLYGLAWSHPNAGGVAGNLNTHGLLVMENGTFLAAISGSIRSRDDMRAPIFYDSQDTAYYGDFAGTSNLNYLNLGNTREEFPLLRMGAAGRYALGVSGAYTRLSSHNAGIGVQLGSYDGTTFGARLTVGNDGNVEATTSLRAPIFYDSNDTAFYVDPNGTSNLNKFSERTMAFNDMNPKSINSPYVDRYNGSVGYRNGTMGYANTDFNTIARNWGSGFIDTWSSPANAPGGSSHYIGLQGVHYSDGGTSFYGFQMACAGEADNRFFWRSSWPSMRSWVEMIHSGNIGSQSVNYASSAGNSATTSQIVFSDLKTNFPSGGGGGHSFAANHYSMGLDSGNGGWSHPHYRDVIIGYHTGIRIGAHYSGIRFYNNSPTTDANNDGNGDGGEALLMTIGGYVGTANHTDVVVNNNLFANVSMRAPIFYDSNNTGYYGDFASTSVMNAIRLGTSTNNGTISGGGDWGIRFANDNGWIQFGPANNSWTHIYSDKNFYFNQDLYVNGTRVVLNSGSWTISVSGSANSLDSGNYISRTGTSGDYNQDFRNTPAGSVRHLGDDANATNNPGGAWWFIDNYRHSNGSSFWGTQVAWGWEDNANRLATRNVISGTFGAWVYYLNSSNFTTYAQEKENQRLSTGSDVTHNSTTSPTFLVNNHSDNTKGYRIHNTSGSSVSAMFTNSSNQLVIAAGAVDQINLNKKVFVNAVALGVNIAPSATAGRIDASNDIVAFSSSDERLKQNITPIANALDKVKSLTGVEFDWKPEHKEAHGHEGHDTGIIAQQVLGVMPTAVRTNDTGFLAVRYEKLIGLLIEGMKEQQEQINELKAKLDGLTK